MTLRTSIAAATACAALATAFAAMPARAGGDLVAFPESYATGVLYTTVDRPDNKQYRELYVSPPGAIEAAKKGEPLPSGTVLTLPTFKARLDDKGELVRDPHQRIADLRLG